MALTANQLSYWRDSRTLYVHALAVTEGNYLVHNNLGITFARHGNLGKAMEYFSEALRINPDSMDARYNLGSNLAAQGKYEEAIAHFTEILRLNPGATRVRVSLGKVYWLSGDRENALKEYEIIKANDEKLAADFMTWIERSGSRK